MTAHSYWHRIDPTLPVGEERRGRLCTNRGAPSRVHVARKERPLTSSALRKDIGRRQSRPCTWIRPAFRGTRDGTGRRKQGQTLYRWLSNLRGERKWTQGPLPEDILRGVSTRASRARPYRTKCLAHAFRRRPTSAAIERMAGCRKPLLPFYAPTILSVWQLPRVPAPRPQAVWDRVPNRHRRGSGDRRR